MDHIPPLPLQFMSRLAFGSSYTGKGILHVNTNDSLFRAIFYIARNQP
jgi:hypothetical protein